MWFSEVREMEYKNEDILEEFAKTQDWQNIDYGKRNGKRFWIIKAYGNVIEKFNEWLQHSEYLKYVQEESNWDEVRYDDDSVWLDFLTDDNWGYSDQYAKCNHCNCVIEYISTTSGYLHTQTPFLCANHRQHNSHPDDSHQFHM